MNDFYYRKLKVYHQSKQLVAEVYRITHHFPPQEQYHFLEIAYGSLMEVMCQLEVAELLNYLSKDELEGQESKITEISKMLISLRKTIEEKQSINR